jgi:shikimate kinase
MDQQTMRDYIEDLMEERAKLYEQITNLKALISSLCDGIIAFNGDEEESKDAHVQ